MADVLTIIKPTLVPATIFYYLYIVHAQFSECINGSSKSKVPG